MNNDCSKAALPAQEEVPLFSDIDILHETCYYNLWSSKSLNGTLLPHRRSSTSFPPRAASWHRRSGFRSRPPALLGLDLRSIESVHLNRIRFVDESHNRPWRRGRRPSKRLWGIVAHGECPAHVA